MGINVGPDQYTDKIVLSCGHFVTRNDVFDPNLNSFVKSNLLN